MKNFAIVVAMDEARGIGKAGGLAWHLPEDLKHFKEVTSAPERPGTVNAVIMGRKTWESLPPKFRPLPGRVNIVVTTQKDFALPQEVIRAANLQQALEKAQADPKTGHIFVIGGGQIFEQAVGHPACRQIFATFVQGTFGCDAFFPVIPPYFTPAQAGPWLAGQALNFRFFLFQAA